MSQNIINLPRVLIESGEYTALGAQQRESLMRRLSYCNEICQAGIDAESWPESELLERLDNIELDALAIMSYFGDPDTTLSSYRIHSSWTFECSRSAMIKYATPDLTGVLLTAPYGFKVHAADAKGWVAEWARGLASAIGKLGGAASFTEAIAMLIIIDALVTSYLTFAASARLNPYLD